MDESKIKKRQEILNYFKSIAVQENNKNAKVSLLDLLNKDDNKRILVTLPESIGDLFLASSLFESIRKRYPKPEWTFYFSCKPEYFEIFEGNPYIDKLIPFAPEFDNVLMLEGMGGNKGLFDIVYSLQSMTQRLANYVHNSADKHDLELIK